EPSLTPNVFADREIQAVQFLVAPLSGRRRHIAKADDAELVRTKNLEAPGLFDQKLSEFCKPAAMFDQPAKPADAEDLHREPDFERREGARRRDAGGGKFALALVGGDVLLVLGKHREGSRQLLAVEKNHPPRLKSLSEPFMRIERDRIRP